MSNTDEIKKQVEYYFSDKNLATDQFFREKITADPEGWMDMSFIMSSNKIKKLTNDAEVVASALESSSSVEVSGEVGSRKLRRKDNQALPPLNEAALTKINSRKRDKKDEEKKAEEPTGELTERHFKSTKVFIFEHEGAEGKADWRALEDELKLKFPHIRILYSRSDEEKTGHLVLCSLGLEDDFVDNLLKNKIENGNRVFSFKLCDEE